MTAAQSTSPLCNRVQLLLYPLSSWKRSALRPVLPHRLSYPAHIRTGLKSHEGNGIPCFGDLTGFPLHLLPAFLISFVQASFRCRKRHLQGARCFLIFLMILTVASSGQFTSRFSPGICIQSKPISWLFASFGEYGMEIKRIVGCDRIFSFQASNIGWLLPDGIFHRLFTLHFRSRFFLSSHLQGRPCFRWTVITKAAFAFHGRALLYLQKHWSPGVSSMVAGSGILKGLP